MMGGINCHADIVFEDGVVWLARFRILSVIAPPPDVRDYVLQSLERHTRVPSPRVFDWACESDPTNTIGVGYILMEKLNGTPLHWQSATAVQKEKIVRQFADIMLEIERHPFDKLGSLIGTTEFSSGEATQGAAVKSQIQVGALAEHSTFRSGDGGMPLGPFRSSNEAFRAIVEANMRMVPHADEKGDHILVNENFDIVGIIDWEWCSTASRKEAFSSPQMMWPVDAFYDGSNELAEEELLLARVFRERGRQDLASCVLHGRKVQRLLFALHSGVAQLDKKTFASLFVGLKRAFDGHDFTTDAQGVEDEWKVWKAKALGDWKHEALFKSATEENDRLAATYHAEAPIAG
ncbi:hypothetical protein E4U37_003076 [Claviceps purpurea]|nr:hypothetical protein E4U37_003076 [Claviceps purpurea]